MERLTTDGHPLSGDEPGADDERIMSTEAALGNMPNKATVLANLRQFEAEQQSHQLQLRARFTLDALNLLARYKQPAGAQEPDLVFGSFPISILPDPSLQNPFAIVSLSPVGWSFGSWRRAHRAFAR